MLSDDHPHGASAPAGQCEMAILLATGLMIPCVVPSALVAVASTDRRAVARPTRCIVWSGAGRARFVRLALPLAALLTLALGLGADEVGAAEPSAVQAEIKRGTLLVRGSAAADTLALRARAASSKLEVDVGDDGSADLRFKRDAIKRIVVRLGDGDDRLRIDDTEVAFSRQRPTAIDGGPGNDALNGGRGREVFLAGDGNDVVDGNRGDDTALLGAGDDRFVWSPGDGSDCVEGHDGQDELQFNGSAASESFDVAASDDRVRFTRDVGNVVMDLDDVERIASPTRGGVDTVSVGDLSGTDVNDVDIDLTVAEGASLGDGQNDRVVLAGTPGHDFADILASSFDATTFALGLPALVRVRNAELGDTLTFAAMGGDDRVNASTNVDAPQLTVRGGAGDDSLFGGDGEQVLLGGAGTDFVDGGSGDDVAQLGAGDDIFTWDPGEGSDVVEGRAGRDVMLFRGSSQSETFAITANGDRVRFLRDIGDIVMDLDDVEAVETLAQAGADVLTVGDLSTTDLGNVEARLSNVPGGPATDLQEDRVVVDASNRDDAIVVTGSAGPVTGTVNVTGLPAAITLSSVEGAHDRLTVNGLRGDDSLDDSGLAPGVIGLTFDE